MTANLHPIPLLDDDYSTGGDLLPTRASGVTIDRDDNLVTSGTVTAASFAGAIQGTILFSLHSAREVDANGDVGNLAAAGGILASDSTPILRADAAESEEISWATGNVDPIAFQTSLPSGFDGSANATVELEVYSGATDAATFTIETSWDGGALVSDSASDAATKSATVHTISATIAAADIPNTAKRLTMAITPTNAHATNAYQICSVRLLYKQTVAAFA